MTDIIDDVIEADRIAAEAAQEDWDFRLKRVNVLVAQNLDSYSLFVDTCPWK